MCTPYKKLLISFQILTRILPKISGADEKSSENSDVSAETSKDLRSLTEVVFEDSDVSCRLSKICEVYRKSSEDFRIWQ